MTAYVLSAMRTPIGRFGGALKDLSPVDLAAHIMSAALQRAAVESADLDLFIFGNILRAGHGQLLPRYAALKAGIPVEVDGYALDMVCSSGMMSVSNADMAIRAGDAQLVLAGGVESMSQAAFVLSHRARWGYKLLLGTTSDPLTDVILRDGLSDPMSGELMGEQTERLIAACDVTRSELDEVAYLSHQRAAMASERGWFAAELAPLAVTVGKRSVALARDEGIRSETTPEILASLAPVFRPDGALTAGNSSQMSDGAAALVLAGEAFVRQRQLRPLARILGSAWAGREPWRFVETPIFAIAALLKKLKLSIHDFDLVENNEAFALNNVLLSRAYELPYDRLNVHGGAIALGHPIGASGARILATLVHALRQHGKRRGLATLCHGTGGATAVAVEIVDEGSFS
jgi:acetyl-CoA C-acetyltransferase